MYILIPEVHHSFVSAVKSETLSFHLWGQARLKELFLREDIFGAIPGFLSWSKWSKELLTIFEVFEISLDLFSVGCLLVMQGRRKNSEEAVDCFVGEPQAPASPFGLSGLSGWDTCKCIELPCVVEHIRIWEVAANSAVHQFSNFRNSPAALCFWIPCTLPDVCGQRSPGQGRWHLRSLNINWMLTATTYHSLPSN